MPCYSQLLFGRQKQKEAKALLLPAGGKGGELALFVLPLGMLGMDCLLT